MCSLSLQNEFWKYLAPLYKTWILTRRNAFTIVEVVFWPTVALVTIGFLTTFLGLTESEVSFVLIGAIALGVLQVSQVNIAYTLLFDVWSKSVKHTFTCPIKGHHLILGSLLLGIIMGMIVFLILMAFSYYVFNFNFLVAGPLPILVFLVGLFLNAAILGTIVCISALIFGKHAEIAAWSLSGIMFLLCGIYYPISVLPACMQVMAKAIPLTYFLEYFRSFYGFGSHNIIFGLVLAVVYFILCIIIFNKTITWARKTGMLLRLSE